MSARDCSDPCPGQNRLVNWVDPKNSHDKVESGTVEAPESPSTLIHFAGKGIT